MSNHKNRTVRLKAAGVKVLEFTEKNTPAIHKLHFVAPSGIKNQ